MFTPVHIINKVYKLYILLFLSFLIIGFSSYPSWYIAFLQLLMWALGFALGHHAIKASISHIYTSIFLFQTISILAMVWVNFTVYNDVLGFDPHDALFYRDCGELYGKSEFSVFFAWLILQLGTIDDWGFPILVWVSYHIFGDFGSWIILLLNVIVITIGSVHLYKLSLYFLKSEYAKLVALFWGMMPFSVYTAASGSKENFFLFVVINVFYYLYRFREKHTIKTLILLIFYCLGVFLFRLATGYIVILCILSVWFFNRNFVKKYFISISFICLLVSFLFFPILVDIIAQDRGMSYEQLSNQSSNKAGEVGGCVAYIVNFVAGIIGPFPNFISNDSDKINFITRYSFSPLLKMVVSFFFYFALLRVFWKKNLYYMPILMFVLLNTLMIIFSFFALHVRFHWPHIPFFLLFSVWGYVEYVQKCHKYNLYAPYLLFVIALILFYNLR